MQILYEGKESVPDTEQMLYTLFVPLTTNKGGLQPVECRTWLQGELLSQAGGLTQYGLGTGFWLSPSAQVYQDQVMPVQVMMPSSPETDAWVAAFAAEVALVFEQEKVFVFGQKVFLVQSAPFPVSAALNMAKLLH